MATSTLIKNARIFDGEAVISERGYILLGDGLIKEIGETDASPLPAADIIVDAAGHTIVPGLIDAHVHIHGGADELAQALNFGVTTVLDLFNEPAHIAELKAESSVRADIADIKSACHAATVKGGWPAPVIMATATDKEKALEQIGTWPTLSSPDQAEDYVVDITSKGADFIKLMQESGAVLLGKPLPTPSPELQSAIVNAAHKHGLVTLAHAITQEATLSVLAAGVDGLAHSFCDEAPNKDALLSAYRQNNSFLVPTLVVSATITGAEEENTEYFARHPLFSKLLDDSIKTCYCGRMILATEGCKVDFSYETVKILHGGGIDIVAGTDSASGLRGTTFGLSLHQELYLYVERCGLTPLEALRSATATTARRFKLDDRGRVAKWKRADLLMVKGDPTKDITCTLNITGIWRGGVAAESVGK